LGSGVFRTRIRRSGVGLDDTAAVVFQDHTPGLGEVALVLVDRRSLV